MFLLALSLWPSISKAEVNNTTISWSNAKPITITSKIVSFIDPGTCHSFLQTKEISGEIEPKKVCLTASDTVNFGTYYTGSGSEFTSAVSFPFDSKMYHLNGICYQYSSCLYLPNEDAIVTKQYLINGIVKSLVIYKNFSKRLERITNPSNLSTEYNFNTSNPDYIFRNNDGYAWPIGGINASNNGRWLAIEFRQRGIGLLNIQTLQMRRISTYAYNYGSGMDPTSELAVSNDGEHLAIMGQNAGFAIFDINSACGDIANDDNMASVLPIAHNCMSSPVNPGDFIDRFNNAYLPAFSDDGGELNFFITSYTEKPKQITLQASGYTKQIIDYLALGDSFSSGEGESSDIYYLSGTNDKYEKCHISVRSYPFIIAQQLNINPLLMKSVACSGATTEDVIGNNDSYIGQNNRFAKIGLSDTEITLAKNQADLLFLPGRVTQGSFVEKYEPKIITIGIGGNDAGFMQKLQTCIGSGTCTPANTDIGKEQTAIEIRNIYSKLIQTYQNLHTSSPNSKIYAIGYPKIINESEKCNLLNGILLDSAERKFMNEGVSYLNQVIKAAAETVGIGFIDTQNSFGDQVLCGKIKPSAMNAIRIGDDSIISDKLNKLIIIGNESFHPNALGHTYIANSIIKSTGNLTTYSYCSDSATICPHETPAPEPSNYWIKEYNHNYPTKKISTFVYNRNNTDSNYQKRILIKDKSLAPSSSVIVEITTSPIRLGKFQTSESGALDENIDLPINLEEGYHTVHLYGNSYSGEPVEMYQVIEYINPTTKSTKQSQNIVKNNNLNTANKLKPDVIANMLNETNQSHDISTLASNNPEVKGTSIIANNPASISKRDTKEDTNGVISNNQIVNNILPTILSIIFLIALVICVIKM